MTTATVLTFEYDQERQILLLAGDAVESWDEQDRHIARISVPELVEHKRHFHNDVKDLELGYDDWLGYMHDPGYVYERLYELYLAGRKFWRVLSGDQVSWLWRLREALTNQLPDEWWLDDDPYGQASRVYHVQTKGPRSALLPLDTLPLGELESAISADEEADVRLLASYFGGFVSIVRHSPNEGGKYVHSPSTTRSTLFLRSTSVGLHDEMGSILSSIGGPVLGPFPSAKFYRDAGDIARALVLSEPALGDQSAIPDLVQVHAHARQIPGMAQSLRLTLDYGRNQTVVLRSSHIESVLAEIESARRRDITIDSGPLVVFNACQALGTIGTEALSTGLDLSQHGSRGVTGPREVVLEEFAVPFSEALHAGLSDGSSIGEAAVGARWSMLVKYLNPLGLLYATFGDVESKRGLSAPLGNQRGFDGEQRNGDKRRRGMFWRSRRLRHIPYPRF